MGYGRRTCSAAGRRRTCRRSERRSAALWKARIPQPRVRRDIGLEASAARAFSRTVFRRRRIARGSLGAPLPWQIGPFRIKVRPWARPSEPHRTNFQSDSFDSGVKLDQLDPSFGGPEPLGYLPCLIEGFAKFGEPTCSPRRRICIRYSIHLRPPVIRCSLLQRVSFALSSLRSGAEFV